MHIANPQAVNAAFHKVAVKKIEDIANVLWPWTVPNGVKDLAKMLAAAIKLGGLDPEIVKEFSEEEVASLGEILEGYRRLEMNAETREALHDALGAHGVILEILEVSTGK